MGLEFPFATKWTTALSTAIRIPFNVPRVHFGRLKYTLLHTQALSSSLVYTLAYSRVLLPAPVYFACSCVLCLLLCTCLLPCTLSCSCLLCLLLCTLPAFVYLPALVYFACSCLVCLLFCTLPALVYFACSCVICLLIVYFACSGVLYLIFRKIASGFFASVLGSLIHNLLIGVQSYMIRLGVQSYIIR